MVLERLAHLLTVRGMPTSRERLVELVGRPELPKLTAADIAPPVRLPGPAKPLPFNPRRWRNRKGKRR